jgi:competence protein ComGC
MIIRNRYHDSRPREFSLKPFSLVELIIVIAIIAVLMTLLAPSLSRLLNQSTLVNCRHHLKEIGIIVFVYSEDHNDIYPNADLSGTNQAGRMKAKDFLAEAWRTGDKSNLRPLLKPYVSSLDIFECPMVKDIYSNAGKSWQTSYNLWFNCSDSITGIDLSGRYDGNFKSVDRRRMMLKVGDSFNFKFKNGYGGSRWAPNDLRYRIIANDFVNKDRVVNHPTLNNNAGVYKGSWFDGYKTYREYNSNFLFDDGSTKMFTDFFKIDITKLTAPGLNSTSQQVLPLAYGTE